MTPRAKKAMQGSHRRREHALNREVPTMARKETVDHAPLLFHDRGTLDCHLENATEDFKLGRQSLDCEMEVPPPFPPS